MLSEATLVALKQAHARTYVGTCDVVEHQKTLRENKTTAFEEVLVAEGVPCRLSYTSKAPTTPQDLVAEVEQVATLFIAPEVEIRPGSKVVVTQHGIPTAYCSSGQPAIYETHQEIRLTLFERWT